MSEDQKWIDRLIDHTKYHDGIGLNKSPDLYGFSH